MATTNQPLYGTSQTITTTALQTLASSATAGWQSDANDNESDLALAVLIHVQAALASGSPANDKTIYVYVYESEDGTDFTDNATGSEGALTRHDPTNMRLIGTIACPDSGSLTYKQVFQYAPTAMPRKWGLFINNFTGLAFTAAVIRYTPVQGQSV
jgi:hypothetical protein